MKVKGRHAPPQSPMETKGTLRPHGWAPAAFLVEGTALQGQPAWCSPGPWGQGGVGGAGNAHSALRGIPHRPPHQPLLGSRFAEGKAS